MKTTDEVPFSAGIFAMWIVIATCSGIIYAILANIEVGIVAILFPLVFLLGGSVLLLGIWIDHTRQNHKEEPEDL